MRTKLIIHFLLLSILFPLIKPDNNSIINYTHVLFEWHEISDVELYQLIVTSNNQTIIDITTTNFFYIDKSNIAWNSAYSWQVCESENPSNCSELYNFSTVCFDPLSCNHSTSTSICVTNIFPIICYYKNRFPRASSGDSSWTFERIKTGRLGNGYWKSIWARSNSHCRNS